MTKKLNILATFVMLFSCLTFSAPTIHANRANRESYNIHEACNMTRHKDLCIKSLASLYSNNTKRSLVNWTRAGVSVTIAEVKSVSKYLSYLKRHNNSHSHVAIRGSRNRAALFDCVECIQETLYSLRISLDSLRRLSVGHFEEQMIDVVTWLSAALTGEDTCIDGFEGRRGKAITRLCNKVKNASYVTTNALALATVLVHAGPKTLGDEYP